MITSNVETFEQALKIASRFKAPIGAKTFYAFRGHSNVSYTLTPSLSRILQGKIKSELEAYELEMRLTFEFRRRTRHHRPTINPGTWGGGGDSRDYDLWQKMQHHGAPTRLLDWTRSFYIALYFAVSSSLESDGEIIVIDTAAMDEWRGMQTDEKPPYSNKGFEASLDKDPQPLLFTPVVDFERAIIQQGLFTMPTRLLCDHDALFADAHKKAGLEMQQVLIRKECKPVILSQLVAMNLTAATLFPGVDGIARSVQELAFLATVDTNV